MEPRIATTPITWGFVGNNRWGIDLPRERILSEIAEIGFVAIEAGVSGFLPEDGFEAKIILEKGSIQLTTNQRKQMVEQKRQLIIQEIHSTAIDPKAKTPHPRTRIELALEESRFSVDPFKRLELQVKDAINILKPLIPLSFEPVRIAFRISGSSYGQTSKFLRPYLDKDEWLSNGDWACIIQCPPGMAGSIIGKVKGVDKNADVKEL